MIDLKSWQTDTHRWLTGRGHHRVFQTIEFLAEQQKLHEVRLLHIPGKSDLDTEIESVGWYLNALPSSVHVRLNAFQHHGVVGEARSWDKCSKEEIEQLKEQLGKFVDRPIAVPSVFV